MINFPRVQKPINTVVCESNLEQTCETTIAVYHSITGYYMHHNHVNANCVHEISSRFEICDCQLVLYQMGFRFTSD